jgi:PKD repeat protein
MMMKMGSGPRLSIAAVALVASVLAGGCALDDADIPPLTGPSEFGLSVAATATPDRLPRDGSSQSVITLNVRDAQNRPVAGQRLTLVATPGSALLSVAEVVTDASGLATFTVTAPPAGAIAGSSVQILATPIGNASGGAVPRTIEVQLSGSANRTAPSFPPSPAPPFTVTPPSPEVGQVASFDGSGVLDEGAPCGDACTYVWRFGTEAVRTGRVQTHAFATPGIHSVVLTVTDAAGTSASAQMNVTVTAAARPTVTFTFSPASPFAGEPATFTATGTAGANHRITRFDWNFGDGSSVRSTSNASITHSFTTPGTYVVTVTATDDLGQTAIASNAVVVVGGAIASFTASPSNPVPDQLVNFDGSASTSTGGRTIVEWTWNFGDGSDPVTESDATVSHSYDEAGTYIVRLTVRDSAGRTGTTTQNVAVAEPEEPEP